MAAATVTISKYRQAPVSPGRPDMVRLFFRYEPGAAHFGELNDLVKLAKAHRGMHPTWCKVWCESDFDDDGSTPTHTFSLICTDGTTTKVLITDSVVARLGSAPAIDEPATAAELALLQPATAWIDSDKWEYQLKCTAAAASETSDGTIAVIIDLSSEVPSEDFQETGGD